jgi:hypothetical protein
MPRKREDEKVDRLDKVEVGSIVGVRFASEVRSAEVIEDRGNLGPEGERVVRLRVRVPPDEETEFEMPVSWLVSWPPSAETQPARPRRRPRHRDAGRKPTPA